MSAAAGPRIGIAGFFLEANRRARVTTAAMFAQGFDLAGERLLEQLKATPPRTLPDLAGFMAGMNVGGRWEPVALQAAAAYPDVPVAAVLDLHTNVSTRMTNALSAFVAYRTNPHVDLFERGEESSRLLGAMLSDGPGEVVLEKLPFVPASTDQLIAPGTPYQALIDAGQAQLGGPILNVSLCGGFPLSDCAQCGFSVVISAQHGSVAPAREVAHALAVQVWARRRDFVMPLTPLHRAVLRAVAAATPPSCCVP